MARSTRASPPPHLEPDRRPPTTAPDLDQQPPADPGAPAAPRPPGLEPGEWEIPRVPLQDERAALAGAAVREKLRTTVAARGRAYDAVAHQQAAMPEQLSRPQPPNPTTTARSRRPTLGRRPT
ncbi:hypothetical protein ACFWJW_34470 [Streptomyces sp. NPDC127097]|uniref:hypothetical protein n=1 Tax=Streptomyces sp. NPDC127097 TaxID=3347136 RepID=UPI003667749D